MVLGCEELSPPGKCITTDEKCPMSQDEFSTYYDNDAMQDGEEEVIPEGEYLCTGCQETKIYGDFEHVSIEEVYASRDKKIPGWNDY